MQDIIIIGIGRQVFAVRHIAGQDPPRLCRLLQQDKNAGLQAGAGWVII